MKISIASDHAGYNSKQSIIKFLEQKKIKVLDLGTNSIDSVDYPEYGQKVAKSVISKKTDKGIVVCGTGIGISIAANRFKNIRASLCTTVLHAEMTRKHNDSNILALGSRTTKIDDMLKIIDVWINTEFEGGRHQDRINKIDFK
ncbi:MAG: ribose 5-phosphate isomerase B [Candidatus Marinimicrobia bacterium]|nr:ribose 5-phosphate isomerase B [Candidatus Neomarinimicrobiota bacterium]|tara:strand:- start:2901 stop:3332 length:432 start_codon:yes stop_codon:yes gene_type:complete